jgi:hypothetical protein
MGLFRRKKKNDVLSLSQIGDELSDIGYRLGEPSEGDVKGRCDECGDVATHAPSLVVDDPNTAKLISVEGMGGYCPTCQRFLCWRHLEFIDRSGGTSPVLDPALARGQWVLGCARDQVEVQ